MKQTLINADRGGYFRCVKSNYWKQSETNLLETTRKNYMATGVLIEYETEENQPNPLTALPR